MAELRREFATTKVCALRTEATGSVKSKSEESKPRSTNEMPSSKMKRGGRSPQPVNRIETETNYRAIVNNREYHIFPVRRPLIINLIPNRQSSLKSTTASCKVNVSLLAAVGTVNLLLVLLQDALAVELLGRGHETVLRCPLLVREHYALDQFNAV